MSDIRAITQYFQNKHISLSEEWLNGCLTWVKEEYSNNCTPEQIQLKVFEQWQLLDLREVHIPILPPRVTLQNHLIINKPLCLQLMSIVDISKPKLFQLQRIRNNNIILNHTEETVSGKRVLQLTLTDGVQEILATEYKPNPNLNINMSPGLKLLVMPPITIRRGQILLEPKSINVLGGEVEDLLITNAPENVLAKALGLPINNNPVTLQETIIKPNQTIPLQTAVIKTNPEHNLLDDADFNEDFLNEIDKIETSSSINQINQTVTRLNQNSLNKIETPTTFTKQEPSFNDGYDQDELDELLKLENEIHHSPPKKVKSAMTISKLLAMKKNVTRGNFTVHVTFRDVTQKLRIANNEYSIKITVGDDTGEMDVYMHSDVVANMVGYDAEAMMALKHNEDPTILDTRMKAMQGFREKLLELDGKVKILIESSRDSPTIVQIL